MELRGTEGGKRARLRISSSIRGPRGHDVGDSSGGCARGVRRGGGRRLRRLPAPIVPEDRLGQMEDILIGAKNLVTLAAYVRERDLRGRRHPAGDLAGAVAAADRLLADADEGEVRKAKGERCRLL